MMTVTWQADTEHDADLAAPAPGRQHQRRALQPADQRGDCRQRDRVWLRLGRGQRPAGARARTSSCSFHLSALSSLGSSEMLQFWTRALGIGWHTCTLGFGPASFRLLRFSMLCHL